ncbi:hypothetical protein D3C83_162050 [compost metagenome]
MIHVGAGQLELHQLPGLDRVAIEFPAELVPGGADRHVGFRRGRGMAGDGPVPQRRERDRDAGDERGPEQAVAPL